MVTLKNTFSSLLVGILIVFSVGCSSSGGSADNAGLLSIKAAVYDDNKTATLLDDRLYIYFDKSINIDTIKDNLSNNFDIDGVGSFGDSYDYDDSMFHRLEITLVDEEFIAGSTTIALSKESALKELFVISNIPVTITSPKTVLPVGSGSYTPTPGGTESVIDDATGLIWEIDDDNDEKTWNEAKGHCEGLNKDGLSWRLPTIDELISLTDKNASSPSIDDSIFTSTKSAEYWTGSEYLASSEDDIWTVNFSDSNTNDPDKTAEHYIRCVSSQETTSTSSYTRDDVNAVVLDTSRSLMWEDTPDTINTDNTKTWDEAKAQCTNLELAGYNDWRLPNINELDSVTDKNTYGPAMSLEFEYTASSIFWSSTTKDISDDSKAWYIYFKCGCSDIQLKTAKSQVRCVRSVD